MIIHGGGVSDVLMPEDSSDFSRQKIDPESADRLRESSVTDREERAKGPLTTTAM
jgi:hypothetical protein